MTPGQRLHPCHPSIWKTKAEDQELLHSLGCIDPVSKHKLAWVTATILPWLLFVYFQVSLGYIVRLYIKERKTIQRGGRG